MNRIFLSLLIIGSSVLGFAQEPIQNYEYKFKLKGLPENMDGLAYLSKAGGNSKSYIDTAKIHKGALTFTGSQIESGLYSLVLEDQMTHFDFVASEPALSFKTKFADIIGSMKIKESGDKNQILYDYLKTTEDKSKEAEQLRTELSSSTGEERNNLQVKLDEVEKSIDKVKSDFETQNPELLSKPKVEVSPKTPDSPETKEVVTTEQEVEKIPSAPQEPILNYEYTFKITGVPDSIDSAAFLANYYGSRQYYFDTVAFDNGVLKFTGEKIKGGIYSVILEDRKSYFEFVVTEPKLEMETKFGDFVGSMKVKSPSEENQKFYEYLSFIEGKSKGIGPLRSKLEKASGKEKEEIQDQLRDIDLAVVDYKKKFMAENPNLFITKVFRASAEPEIPEFNEIADEEERKKMRYKEFKNRYLEGVDFQDDRLLRTPVLHNKYKYYMNKLVAQVPDSVIKEADMLIDKARGNKEVYKYLVHTITSKYEDSKIMGMDAVLVHMGQKYYCGDEEAWWLEEKKLEKFCERVNAMAPLQIGKTAPNLILMDTTEEKWHNLHHVASKFTVLYFWDSGCGHCKKVTPKLKEFYETYHQKGVEVFAVGTEFENKEWKKYIRKHELPWLNVSDSPWANENAQELMLKGITTAQSLNFRDTYDIFSTPKIFLLDENKKIIAVKLMPEQLGDFIDHLLEEDAKG